MSELPTIRIKNAWLLRENVSRHLHKLWGKDEELVDYEWIEGRVAEYKKAWQPYEQKVLLGMTETLGLSFRQNIIDVYIAPWLHAFSDPLVIGVNKEPDLFVDILTHELIHRLLTDNTAVPSGVRTLPEWKRLFGEDQPFKTLVHIPVHAVHKALYLDVLNEPARLERDITNNKVHKATAYMAAWDYVEKYGYGEIVEKLRESYGRLSSSTKS